MHKLWKKLAPITLGLVCAIAIGFWYFGSANAATKPTIPDIPVAHEVSCDDTNTVSVSTTADFITAYQNDSTRCINVTADLTFTTANATTISNTKMNHDLHIDGGGHTLTARIGLNNGVFTNDLFRPGGNTVYSSSYLAPTTVTTFHVSNWTIIGGGEFIDTGTATGAAHPGWNIILENLTFPKGTAGTVNSDGYSYSADDEVSRVAMGDNARIFFRGNVTSYSHNEQIYGGSVIVEPGASNYAYINGSNYSVWYFTEGYCNDGLNTNDTTNGGNTCGYKDRVTGEYDRDVWIGSGATVELDSPGGATTYPSIYYDWHNIYILDNAKFILRKGGNAFLWSGQSSANQKTNLQADVGAMSDYGNLNKTVYVGPGATFDIASSTQSNYYYATMCAQDDEASGCVTPGTPTGDHVYTPIFYADTGSKINIRGITDTDNSYGAATIQMGVPNAVFQLNSPAFYNLENDYKYNSYYVGRAITFFDSTGRLIINDSDISVWDRDGLNSDLTANITNNGVANFKNLPTSTQGSTTIVGQPTYTAFQANLEAYSDDYNTNSADYSSSDQGGVVSQTNVNPNIWWTLDYARISATNTAPKLEWVPAGTDGSGYDTDDSVNTNVVTDADKHFTLEAYQQVYDEATFDLAWELAYNGQVTLNESDNGSKTLTATPNDGTNTQDATGTNNSSGTFNYTTSDFYKAGTVLTANGYRGIPYWAADAATVTVVDVTPPNPTTNVSKVYANSDSISGVSDEPGATITVKDGSTVLGTATVGDDGKWTVDLSSATLTQGDTLDLVLTDTAGNSEPVGSSKAFRDATFPAATEVTVNAAKGELGITKTYENLTNPDQPLKVGDQIEYTITLTCTEATCYDINLTDALPDGVDYVSHSYTVLSSDPVTVTGNDVTASFTNMASDRNPVVITIVGTITSDAINNSIENTAHVTADDSTGEQITDEEASDGNTTPVYDKDADVAINKSVANKNGSTKYKVGDTVVYTVTATVNADGGPISNVTIEDNVPSSLTVTSQTASVDPDDATLTDASSGNDVKFTTDKLNAGDVVTITIEATINSSAADSTVSNTATITGDNSDGSDNSETSDPNTTPEVNEPDPTITSTKTFANENGTDIYQVGDTIVYTITTSVANGPAKDVVIADNVNSALSVTSATSSDGTTNSGTGNNVEFNYDEIGAGDTITITIKATITADAKGEQLGNSATIDAKNDAGDDVPEVTATSDDTPTIYSADPTVTSTKTFANGNGTDTYQSGDTIIYTITNNVTNGDAKDLTVVDNVSSNLTVVDVSTTGGSAVVDNTDGNNVNVVFGSVAQDSSAVVTITATINDTAIGSTISNEATVSGDNAAGEVADLNGDEDGDDLTVKSDDTPQIYDQDPTITTSKTFANKNG
ncbi:MAG: isopeptide-forming domain-containing fimbrial protein, partial [Bacilli bacterium]|nr:isopeptide-forming domain-containing fimbrial protein [Bacilli bacterium]